MERPETICAGIGPAIIICGMLERKDRFPPSILSNEGSCAPDFSGPLRGSDLASLQCAVRRGGDDFIVNGAKIWWSHAHWRSWRFMLVRAEKIDRRRRSVSAHLIELTLPGVDVRPIAVMNGPPFHSHLFFDGARAPAEMLVGEAGAGCSAAKGMSPVERLHLGRVAEIQLEFAHVSTLAARRPVAYPAPVEFGAAITAG